MSARRLVATLAMALAPTLAAAHLNSPNVYLEESIGPWPAVTTVLMPPAIPGEARVVIHLTDVAPAETPRVRIVEIPPDGENNAPPWVSAVPLSADASTFIAPMPLMMPGVWKARIEVSGPRGTGTIDVPVGATAPPSRAMKRSLIATLAVLAAFLLVTAALIAQALSRDVYAGPGLLSARMVRLVPWLTASCFIAILGFHGIAWWQQDKALAIRSSRSIRAEVVAPAGPIVAGRPAVLRLGVIYGKNKPVEDVAPDHGKMMHAVVVKVPEMTYFLHVHPKMEGPGSFALTLLPPVAGRYQIFADVLSASGVADTVVAQVTAGAGEAGRASSFDDPDDSDAMPPPVGAPAAAGGTYDLGSGLTMRLVSPAVRPFGVKSLLDLGFELDGPGSTPVDALEPYMGMAGHLLIVRDDLGVFAHVHPMGTVANRMSMPGSHAAMTPEEHAKAMAAMRSRIEGARVSFPYGFPSPGRYRLFAQVKYGGAVRTGVFDVEVR